MRLQIDEALVIERQVDCRAENYIGLRIEDALVRFHGRGAIGLGTHHPFGTQK